jgi:hypothetical protein
VTARGKAAETAPTAGSPATKQAAPRKKRMSPTSWETATPP